MIDKRFFDHLGPLSLGELLTNITHDCPINGYFDISVSNAANLADSESGDISFIDNRRHLNALETAKASACFTTDRLAPKLTEKNITPLIVKSPKAAFGRVINKLFSQIISNDILPQIAETAKIHPSAVIGSGVIIGENVIIGPNVVIGTGVVIGAASQIMNGASIECAILGEGCFIKSGAAIGTIGFGMSHDENGVIELPHIGRALLGKHVRVGANSCVDRGFLQDTILEDDVKLDNLVQIGHNVRVGARSMMASFVGIPGSCNIGCDVIIGGQAGLADHLTVGDGAKIAGHSGIMHNVPAGEVWSGYPGMPVRQHMRVVSELMKIGKAKKNASK